MNNTGQLCASGHQCHPTERAALNALRWARRQPGGKSLRTLNVFKCAVCPGWSVGRAWRGKQERLAAQPKPAPPQNKPRTLGEIRRHQTRMRSPSNLPIMERHSARRSRILTTVFAGSRFATLTATSCSSVASATA